MPGATDVARSVSPLPLLTSKDMLDCPHIGMVAVAHSSQENTHPERDCQLSGLAKSELHRGIQLFMNNILAKTPSKV